ncbi:sialate O-acetylesterase, partial [Parabacteroides sp. OttesenSCG-928-N08]|nr:sialate O-acetylesterase [Parabacteroides sp. OttesenSCG-928-N08]
MRRILLLMALISCLPCLIFADEPPVSWEKLPITFSDNMVLQRDMPLLFQGKASAGERVTIRIHRKKVSTVADKEGRWQLELPTMAAGGPYKLQLTIGRKKWHFSNVMVGEVWLCSGQSNMAFPLAQAVAKPGDNRHHPQLRFFDMKPRWETTATAWDHAALESIQQYDYFSHSGWSLCNPETAERFSAIAYHFGKQLADSLGVTVGLIHHAVGGSPCEAWIDRQTLTERFPQILSDWSSNELIQDWARERALLNIRNSSLLDQHHPYEPTYLFDAAMEPLASYPIKGVIWYQGESNAHDLETYSHLFPIMIDSWRRYWNRDTLPFCFVQLSSINRPTWPAFRDLQRRQVAEIPHTYLTVSSDKGDSLDVHPRQKREIGERLAYSALHHIYDRKEIVPSGPLYESVTFSGDT